MQIYIAAITNMADLTSVIRQINHHKTRWGANSIDGKIPPINIENKDGKKETFYSAIAAADFIINNTNL